MAGVGAFSAGSAGTGRRGQGGAGQGGTHAGSSGVDGGGLVVVVEDSGIPPDAGKDSGAAVDAGPASDAGDASGDARDASVAAGSISDASVDAGETVRIGDSTWPCTTTVAAGLTWIAQPVTLPSALTLQALGVTTNAPASGTISTMALYSDRNGAPDELLAWTTPVVASSIPLMTGPNDLPLTTPVRVEAGQYWLAAEYASEALVCVTDTQATHIWYVFLAKYGEIPSPLFTSTSAQASVEVVQWDLEYYAVGTP
jgi:hypothetical protein